MINMPIEQIIEKIKKEKGLSEEEINKKIDEKLEELSGLVSKKGAAHIVANELDVKLFDIGGRLKIKNILSGMRNVEVIGKVTNVFEQREFSTAKGKGKVGSFLMGDETGTIRVVLWQEKSDLLKTLKKGDIVKLKFGYVKNNNNFNEIHIGDKGEIFINPEGESIGEVKTSSYKRKRISELTQEDKNVEILGTIVQVFDPRFFPACPECGKKMEEFEPGKFKCKEHGEKIPNYSAIMNLIIDDGSENIRTVFFSNQIKNLLNIDEFKLDEIRQKPEEFEKIKNDLLGQIIKLRGNAKFNSFFDRLEFQARFVDANPDPEKELKE